MFTTPGVAPLLQPTRAPIEATALFCATISLRLHSTKYSFCRTRRAETRACRWNGRTGTPASRLGFRAASQWPASNVSYRMARDMSLQARPRAPAECETATNEWVWEETTWARTYTTHRHGVRRPGFYSAWPTHQPKATLSNVNRARSAGSTSAGSRLPSSNFTS
jgi:hypothetical protein